LTSHNLQWLGAALTAVAASLVILSVAPKEAWKYPIQFSAIRETLENAFDSPSTIAPVYDAASKQCEEASSPSSRAEILLWAATRFDLRNAHESEMFLEAPDVFGCAKEYGTLVRAFLHSPSGQTLAEPRQEFLRQSISANPRG
jgi:hypothetical protein